MQSVLFTRQKLPGLSWNALLLFAGCVGALWVGPLRAQDDNAAPPPPVDNGAADQNSPAPSPDNSTDTPDDSASFQTFYDDLGSQGTWIQSSDYGYIWQPPVSDPDWAPYTDGNWVYSDDGWTWVSGSDEPWGWATYHYGRWVNIDGTGWCWVPGYTWAPAWVSWRYGDGYCGWAPLPPDSFAGIDYADDGFAIGIGFHIGGDCDGFYGIGPGWYHFLPVGYLGYRNYHGYYISRGNNYAIINHTTNVTNINVTRSGERSGVTTGGPMLAQVNAVSQVPVQRVSLVRTNQPGGMTLTGNSLALYRPHVNPGSTAQPTRVEGSIGQATINRGTDIMHPLAVNSRLPGSPATEEQVQQARLAQDHVPASAKVLTDGASVKPVLQAPLTSLQPVARQTASSSGLNSNSNRIFNTERSPSVQVVPTVRAYPQTTEEDNTSSHVYYPPTATYSSPPSSAPLQPHAMQTGTSGGSESHSYERPASSYSPQSAPVVHQSGGGSYGGGGATHAAPSGGGYHGGYQQQGH